jgi:alkylresorcinol/alkylpyrone synthase
MPPVGLISLATASPPHDMPQDEVAAMARDVFRPQFPGYDRMAPVFGTAGVHHRQA